MKISVSLSEQELDRVDRFAASSGLPSRSAVIQHAIGLLADAALEEEYAVAWQEWEDSGEAEVWASTVADGLGETGSTRATR